MSTHNESVATASKDALPRDSDVAAHAAPAAAAAAAAFPSSAQSPAHDELTAIKQRITSVEKDILEVKDNRNAYTKRSDLWIRADDELKQLRELLLKEKEQLREEKALLKREERLEAGQPAAHLLLTTL
jgi:hypothetical protein